MGLMLEKDIYKISSSEKDVPLNQTLTTRGNYDYIEINLSKNNGKDKKNNWTWTNVSKVQAWGKTAKVIADYFKDGDYGQFKLEFNNNNYQSEGKTVYKNTFTIKEINFLPRPNDNVATTPQNKPKTQQVSNDSSYDDLEFTFE